MNILGNPPIRHIYRKANVVSNWIIKNFDTFCNDLTIFYQPPSGVTVNILYGMYSNSCDFFLFWPNNNNNNNDSFFYLFKAKQIKRKEREHDGDII